MGRSNATDFRRIQDQQGDQAEITEDGYTYVGKAVHRRIIKDVEYFVGYEFAVVTPGSTVSLSICTRGKFPHGMFSISSNAEFSYMFSVGTTEPDAGATQIYPRNLNRGCNYNRAVAEFYVGETNGDTDIKLECGHVGALDKFESIASRDSNNFWLLDSSCTYHFRITNEDDANSYICIKYVWHEHYPVPGVGLGEGANEYDWSPV